MLGKLLKYELKRSARKFFPLVLGYMIVALIFSLMLRYGESVKSPNFLMIFIVVSIAYGIAVGALFTVGFTISLTNFHKTLFTDEGYLMLTIPVKPYYHIFTKFISSVISPQQSLINVVFPLPFGPSRPIILPLSSARSRLLSAVKLPYCFVSP